jgi:GH24 family phage-related lysozyme (muramidase)
MSTHRYDARLIPWLAGNEGKVNRWYRDPIGVPTIGMGFTMRSREFKRWWAENRKGTKFGPGATMTDAEIFAVKQMLIDKEYGPPVWAFFANASVSSHAMAVAMDMSFNAGYGSLKWAWAKLLKAGRVKEAAARFRVTATTAAGRRLAGLVRRRREGATIMEHNIWPSWVKGADKARTIAVAVDKLPAWKLDDDDMIEAAGWLQALGLWKPAGLHNAAMLRSSIDFRDAVIAFQEQHPNLDDDGVLGRATRDQLQRVIDLRGKAGRSTATGGATSAAGGVETASGQDVTGYSEWLIGAGVAVIIIAIVWLGWRYRDEVMIALRSLTRRKARA